MVITEMIQEELQAVSVMQKALLQSILQSFKEKQQHKVISKMFYAIKNLH